MNFIGDYEQDSKNNSAQASAPKSSNIFSAYQNTDNSQTGNSATTSSTAAQVILFIFITIPLCLINYVYSF